MFPRGQTFSHTGGRGGQIFVHLGGRGTNIFSSRLGTQIYLHRGGGQTIYVEGGGGYVDIGEEIDVSDTNNLARNASKTYTGTRTFRSP